MKHQYDLLFLGKLKLANWCACIFSVLVTGWLLGRQLKCFSSNWLLKSAQDIVL